MKDCVVCKGFGGHCYLTYDWQVDKENNLGGELDGGEFSCADS